ncbi:hypothetical protein FRC08_015329 [Ceratobasidium sp. 394]|nr:hypothetical protein FRC08_015329 [Ceratobasidium sp. 394]
MQALNVQDADAFDLVFGCVSKAQRALVLAGAGISTSSGVPRPDILLYGEAHPQAEVIAECVEGERGFKPDLLVIAGTSLNSTNSRYWHTALAGWAEEVHKRDGALVIYMNDTPPPTACQRFIDLHLTGNLEAWSQKVVSRVSELLHQLFNVAYPAKQWVDSDPRCWPDLPVG